jgi:hypothetical protein
LTHGKAAAISTSAFAFVLLACDGGTSTNDNCLVDLAPISSRTNVLSVGDTVTFEARLGPAECLPAGVESEDWRWSSTDTLIARIDSLTGRAEAVGPGDVLIRVDHAHARGQVASTIGLHVVE